MNKRGQVRPSILACAARLASIAAGVISSTCSALRGAIWSTGIESGPGFADVHHLILGAASVLLQLGEADRRLGGNGARKNDVCIRPRLWSTLILRGEGEAACRTPSHSGASLRPRIDGALDGALKQARRKNK